MNPSASSDPSDDDIENEKTFTNWGRRWSSVRQLTSVPGVLPLLLLSRIIPYIQYLLPSFVPPLSRRLSRFLFPTISTPAASLANNRRTQPRRLSPTAYLDGIRGVAALTVYIFHFTFIWFPQLREGYGSPSTSDPPQENNYLLQLPIIRALINGRASVTIFFVISGFVLPLKTLSELYKSHSSQHESTTDNKNKVLESLSGSLLRRPLRLYPPIIATTAITALLVRIPMFFFVNKPPPLEAWQEQFSDWWTQLAKYNLDLFAAMRVHAREGVWDRENEYNGALWSMTIELKGSVFVFCLVLVLAGFGRSKRWVGTGLVYGAAVRQVWDGDFDMALFCAGLLMAERHVSSSSSARSRKLESRRRRVPHALWHAVTIMVFVLSLHFMGYPEENGPYTWGYSTMLIRY